MKKLLMAMIGLLCIAGSSVAETLTLTTDDCDYFTPHTLDDDVAFKPGVDTDGDPVTPADLNDNAIELPQKISIPIILQLETQTQNDPPGSVKLGQLQDEADLGTLMYDSRTRQLFYQGKLISDGNRQAIMNACDKMQKERTEKPNYTSPAVEK